MDIAVIGTGVIGTIYGQLLAAAGHEVVHIVRPGSAQTARRVIQVDLLDARSESPVEVKTAYHPNLTDRLDPHRPYDLILVSVRHYQLESLLPTLASGAGESEILFFNGLWTSFDPVNEMLKDRYLWGYPVAGGGFEGDALHAALLHDVQLGAPAGTDPQRLGRVRSLFEQLGLKVELQKDMLAWLWVHFAIEAGVIASAMKAGSVPAFLDSVDAISGAVLAVRDALAVVASRGVDPASVPDAQMLVPPAGIEPATPGLGNLCSIH